jgi:PIN domain nuclease of toxin-antitoxin system
VVRLLLDTQVVIVSSCTPERLSARTQQVLVDPTNLRWVSLVSVWEIAIKRATGKLVMTDGSLEETLENLAADELPIRRAHVLAVSNLPPHHRDPFDRLIIAQALAEDLVVVTSDRSFAAYGVRIIPA